MKRKQTRRQRNEEGRQKMNEITRQGKRRQMRGIRKDRNNNTVIRKDVKRVKRKKQKKREKKKKGSERQKRKYERKERK